MTTTQKPSSHTHTYTLPTYLLAVGCLDSEAVGLESYYLRGGLSSWQPLEFMKSQYLLFFLVCDTGQQGLRYQL